MILQLTTFVLFLFKTFFIKKLSKISIIFFSSSFVDVKMEKAQKLVSGIEGFDPAKLRHTETQEKNPLPDKDGE